MKILILSSIIWYLCGAGQVFAVGGNQRISADDILNRYTVRIMLLVKNGADISSGWCSGTLLSADKVLTAAHCVDNNIWRAKVLIGFDNPIKTTTDEKFSTSVEGMSYVANADFLRRQNSKFWRIIFAKLLFSKPRAKLSDLAVIKLAKSIDLPYPIEFSVPDDTVDLSGKKVTIAGYGVGDIGQQPRLARRADVVVKRDYQRSDLLEFTNYFNSVSPGDSGGPVWWLNNAGELQLIGVHSFLFPHFYYYTYSIDIRQHRKWLKYGIQLLDEPDLNIKKSTKFYYHSYFPGYLEDYHRQSVQ